MTKNRFLVSLTWELKNLFRFPFPEILLALFTYLVFIPHGGGGGRPYGVESLSWQRVTYDIAFQSAYRGAFYSVSAYLPMAILACIFATLAFAYEIENGLLKVHLSHPTSRNAVFLSKFLSCFLIIFTTLSCTLLFFTFLYIPENAFYLVIHPRFTLGILLLAGLESFSLVSLTVTFSIFTKKTSISLVGSFATLYGIQLFSQTANLTFLPPPCFYVQVEYLFSRIAPGLSELPSFLANPLISAALTIISYLYFSRRLEVT